MIELVNTEIDQVVGGLGSWVPMVGFCAFVGFGTMLGVTSLFGIEVGLGVAAVVVIVGMGATLALS
jgi:hypothetical protein